MDNNLLKTLPIWQQNHINVCLDLFKDKKVLEVGGSTPQDITKSLGVKSWYCVDPIFEKDDISCDTYKKFKQSITDFNKDKDFDLIFATNAFEHIDDFEDAFKNMYKLLKQGGKLSALFGPIWSCYKGHHIVYKNNGLNIDFNNVKIGNWAHLLLSEEDFIKELAKNYNEENANIIGRSVYHRTGLNRLFYDDYEKIIKNSNFKILEFRDWHTSKYPEKETQLYLEKKYDKNNFSTVSIKILLEK